MFSRVRMALKDKTSIKVVVRRLPLDKSHEHGILEELAFLV